MTTSGPAAEKPARGLCLLSDIHGNLPALEAVLRDIDARGEGDDLYHLGDLVGYAPWPNEVVEVLGERGVQGIAGNYDSTVATDYAHCGCRYEDPHQEALSHLSFAWTKQNCTRATKRRLGALPFRLDLRPMGGHAAGPRVILVHGNPVLNTFYWTRDRGAAFCKKMADMIGARAGDAIVFGHTHLAWHEEHDDIQFVNAGSVGRPKDGDPRAGYVRLTLSPSQITVDIRRVEYDVHRAARAVRESGLPGDFADHLLWGATHPPVAP